MLKNSCKVALKELKQWMKPEKVLLVPFRGNFVVPAIIFFSSKFLFQFLLILKLIIAQVKTPIIAFPSSAEIVAEPLGVVLVISAWNYPICE